MRNFRLGFSLRNLTCAQTIATVFAFFWALCPVVFAAERGKQRGLRIVEATLVGLYGAEIADSLMDQIRSIPIGSSSVARGTVTLELWGLTYTFDQMVRNADGGVSGLVVSYDPSGEKTGEFNIKNVSVTDDNRLDFSLVASEDGENSTEVGTIVGVKGDPGKAVALISTDGGDTVTSLVDFSGLTASTSSAAAVSADSLVTVTPFPGSQFSDGGVASVVGCCILIVIGVALIILIWAFFF